MGLLSLCGGGFFLAGMLTSGHAWCFMGSRDPAVLGEVLDFSFSQEWVSYQHCSAGYVLWFVAMIGDGSEIVLG